MKFLLVIVLLVIFPCTSANRPDGKVNEFVQMNETWKVRPSQEEVIKSFGSNFEKIQEGISYNYEKTTFTKMAFFFDKDKKLVDQFVIVDEAGLNVFKKDILCEWTEKKTQIREAHVVQTVESGECPEQHVKYFFEQDLGLYRFDGFREMIQS